LRNPGRPSRHFVYDAQNETVGVVRSIDLGEDGGTFVAETMPYPAYDVERVIANGFYASVRPRVVLVQGRPIILALDLLHEPDAHRGLVVSGPIWPAPDLPTLTASDRVRLLVRSF
jgi:hypothetical protein